MFKPINIDQTKFVNNNLAQIYYTGLEYCWINRENIQVCNWVLCKDFLSDLVWGHLFNKDISIYGFQFCPTKTPIKLAGNKLGIRNIIETDYNIFINKLQNSLKLINVLFPIFGKFIPIEILGEFDSTKGPNKVKSIVINLPRKFYISPPILSLVTLLIRAGKDYQDGQDPLKYIEDFITKGQTNDASYLKNGLPIIKKLLQDKLYSLFDKKIVNNWPQNTSISIIHGQTGISWFGQNWKDEEKFTDSLKRVFNVS